MALLHIFDDQKRRPRLFMKLCDTQIYFDEGTDDYYVVGEKKNIKRLFGVLLGANQIFLNELIKDCKDNNPEMSIKECEENATSEFNPKDPFDLRRWNSIKLYVHKYMKGTGKPRK